MTPNELPSVLLADDHPIFLRGLREVVELSGQYTIIEVVSDGDKALERCVELRPDFALLDISMPNRSGLDVLAELAPLEGNPTVILLTMYDEYLDRALDLGARGYVLKDRAEMEVLECLERVALGDVFVSASVAAPRAGAAEPSLEELTPTEKRVLSMLATFKTSREIGAELGVSHRTVQNHRARAADKLGLSGPNALLRFAIDHELRLRQ